MPYKINLVEDETTLRELLTSYLERESYIVHSFDNGERSLQSIGSDVDLWILDISLPDYDGFEILNKIREENDSIPVIFISARDRDIDRVVGLEVGADDYMSKPFLPRELIIRVGKLLNRVYGNKKKEDADNQAILFAQYSLYKNRRELFEGDEKIELTSKEFDILLLFSENKGRAFSREQLINRIWGKGYYSSERVVDDLIRRLRSKLKEIPLETIYGYGYRMAEK